MEPAASELVATRRTEDVMSDTNANIRAIIDNNPIVVFMKGTKNFPQCGFSARAVDILSSAA